MKATRKVGGSVLVVTLFAVLRAATAQESGKIDPKHYTVLFENSQVRVLRVTYAPHETSAKDDRPEAAAVLLNDSLVRLRFPDGKLEGSTPEADEHWTPPGKHLPEDIGNAPVELLRVELKGNTRPSGKVK
jgi:hypothetical protein